MTELTRIELALSESRVKLEELGANENPTEAEVAEIGTTVEKHKVLEARFRALKASEPEKKIIPAVSAEARERQELVNSCSLGVIFSNVAEHRASEGPEKELQKELGLQDNHIPLVLLRAEERTAGLTPAPGNVESSQSEIIPAVFPMACAAFLGVDMPTVPVGEAVFPVLSSSASPGTPAKGASKAHDTAAFTADLLAPKRIQASFFYTREDRARFRGMDASLRQNLSDALADKLDKEILVGANGLLTGTNLADHDVSAVTSYALYRSQLAYGRVDGTYAGTVMDLRAVLGSDSYAHAAGVFRSDNAGDRAALEDLMNVTGGVRVSAHVPATASNKQECVIRLGMRRDMVAPIWEGIEIIFDELTMAKTGEIVLTAVMLHAVKILRAAGFYKQQLQHA